MRRSIECASSANALMREFFALMIPFMQAVGMVNDHDVACFRYQELDRR